MRISHRHQFIFLSRQKCASTSIRKMLNSYSDIFSENKLPYHHHSPALLLKQHFESQGWDWHRYFKFTCVRNPWDLVVSLYSYGKPDVNGNYWWSQDKHGASYDPDTRMEFKDWLKQAKSWDWKKNKWVNNLYPYSLAYMIFDEEENFLVDYILRVENLDADLWQVRSRLGLELECGKLNTSDRTRYINYYDEESKQIISEWFAFDIKFGNYTFDKKTIGEESKLLSSVKA